MGYSFESRITKESKACPGVRFTLNKMTEGRRSKLRMSQAEAVVSLRDIMSRVRRLTTDTLSDPDMIARLQAEMKTLIEDRLTPSWVRWGLHKIEGLEIDGEAATVESLIEEGPPELFAEIAVEIQKAAGLTEEEQGESAPPTTSGGLGDGRTNSSIAQSASDRDTTSDAIAIGISPAP